ncbi:MAG: 4-hydroxythreonine-4-phosphate dehydrogenase PdxA [Anaerolineae bacterium]
MTEDLPVLFITIGDPAGVGPEVVVKALAARSWAASARLVVVGDAHIVAAAARVCGVTADWPVAGTPAAVGAPVVLLDLANVDPAWCRPGRLEANCGAAAYQYIAEAVGRCLRGEGAGIVTAPINKAALNAAGHRFAGHTEILAHLCGVTGVAMLLATPKLRVAHVSTHCSLVRAIERVRPERIERVADLTLAAVRGLGIARPQLAIAGLNPHAGEGGLFGDEERLYITPAIESLRARGVDVSGPEPPDTVFVRAAAGRFDAVVAMYHDQGHIAVKMLGFSEGVNVTLGLPIVRTSVDHGTAFDIAGSGSADSGSMVAAIDLAVTLAVARGTLDDTST